MVSDPNGRRRAEGDGPAIGAAVHEPPLAWQEGVEVAGRYLLERPLSTVMRLPWWRALDMRLMRSVEVRGVDVTVGADSRALQRVRRQLQVLSGIEHEGLSRVYDSLVEGDWLVVVSEALDAVAVGDVLDDVASDRQAALAIGESVFAALAALHQAGVLHRRVTRNAVLLIDHGAKLLATDHIRYQISDSALTTEETLSPVEMAYLAPEVVDGAPPSLASDVYAAGVVLWELLIGRPVDDVLDVPAWTCRLPTVATSPATWDEADEIVRRATVPEPTERYANAGELVEAVRALLPPRPERALQRLTRTVVASSSDPAHPPPA